MDIMNSDEKTDHEVMPAPGPEANENGTKSVEGEAKSVEPQSALPDNHEAAPAEMKTEPAAQNDVIPPPLEKRTKSHRGFAAMDPALVREIASKGGKAAHAAGTAHEFNSDEARQAGRKGGQAAHRHDVPNR
jgi:general stress protein YciG